MRNCAECGSGLSPHEHVWHLPGGDLLCEVCDRPEDPYWKWMLKGWRSVLLMLLFALTMIALFYWIPNLEIK